jgi:hypothetical protein
MNQLRLYAFINFYLSSIQQGIQTGHVSQALTAKYRGRRTQAAKLLAEWEDEGKTYIVLNGGNAAMVAKDLDDLRGAAGLFTCKYPWAAFFEEPGAIHPTLECLTGFGIVLPPEVYNARPVEFFPSVQGFSAKPNAAELGAADPGFFGPGTFEHTVCTLLQGKHLAR